MGRAPASHTGSILYQEPANAPNPTLNIHSRSLVAAIRVFTLSLPVLGLAILVMVLGSPVDARYDSGLGVSVGILAIALGAFVTADILFRGMSHSLTPIVVDGEGLFPPTTLDERLVWRKPAFVRAEEIEWVSFKRESFENRIYRPPIERMTIRTKRGRVYRTSPKVASSLEEVRKILSTRWPGVNVRLEGDDWPPRPKDVSDDSGR